MAVYSSGGGGGGGGFAVVPGRERAGRPSIVAPRVEPLPPESVLPK
eukprot:COSAG02_NODE_4137_length_5726_cov_3.623067_6_plen_46_part_00